MDVAAVGQLAQAEVGLDLTVVDPDTMLAELGIASVDMVMFVYALEDKLAIELTEEELDGVGTVGELLELISCKADGGSASPT